MNKAYSRINWENYPSDATPINKVNLNRLDSATDILDDRVITLDTTKATKTEVATLVSDVTFEESTGIITITKKNGSRVTIDTQLEKIAVNFDYNPTTEQIVLTLIDGTKQYIDLSALITQYEFLDTDTVAFFVGTDGKVSAIVKEGSIEEKHLEPNYLAKIKVEVAKAETSQQAAAKSETNAKVSENAAKASETAAKTSETNAKSSETASKKSETNAKASETAAATSKTSAATSATNAKTSETNAKASETNAAMSASTAAQKATEIIGKAESAAASATKAESYAVGGTGSRDGEDSDNAKYYYQQAKDVSEGLKGGLQPHGTCTFADLPALADVNAGWMFNISDEFTTTDDFKEGSGNAVPAGANIYKTSDGKWDVLAGTPVTGVKGAKETSYRRGNVKLTPENIGAVATGGDTASNVTSFTSSDVADGSAPSWTNVATLTSGETHTSLFAKVSQMFKNVRYLYKMFGTTDISSIGGGTVTGAISSQNKALAQLNNIGNYKQTDTLLVSSKLSANIEYELNTLLLAKGKWLVVSSGELNAHTPFAYNLGLKKSDGDLYGSMAYLCTPHTDTGIWANFLQTYTINVTSDTATASATIKHYAADSNVEIGWARMMAIRLA